MAPSPCTESRRSYDSLETSQSDAREDAVSQMTEVEDVELCTLADQSLLVPKRSTAQRRCNTETNDTQSNEEKAQSTRERTTLRKSHRQHFKAWRLEVVCCLLSATLLIAMTVFLRQYDDKPRPEWPAGLTLNTVVAVLATLCRAMTAISVSEGISQLKWNWFARGERPVRDLYAFDQASRGPWGSLKLLFVMRGWKLLSLVAIAAFVLVSGLGTSFMTQSTIALQDREIERLTDSALIKRSYQYRDGFGWGLEDRTEYTELRRAGLRAVLTEILGTLDASDDEEDVLKPTFCPAGAKCRWPTWSTLAICSDHSNITDHLAVTRNDTSNTTLARLPYEREGNPTLIEFDHETSMKQGNASATIYTSDKAEQPRATWTEWSNQDILRASLSHIVIIYNHETNGTDTDIFGALEVIWHLCVKTYTTNGDVLDYTKITSENRTHFNLTDAGNEETFNVQQISAAPDLFDLFRDRVTWDPHHNSAISRSGQEMSSIFAQIMFYGSNDGYYIPEYDASHENFRDHLKALANGVAEEMTMFLRYRGTSRFEGVAGWVITTETFVVIRWQWLSLLAAQVALTVVLLIAVIIHTARLDVEIVKSSNIAELLAIRKTGGDFGRKGRLTGIRAEVEKKMMARLVREGKDWNLDLWEKTPEMRDRDIQ